MHLLMSIAVLARWLVALLILLLLVAMAHWQEEDHSWSSDSRSAKKDEDWNQRPNNLNKGIVRRF